MKCEGTNKGKREIKKNGRYRRKGRGEQNLCPV